ncbi:MAG: 2'-5' RNA ligase family protein [Oscillospiraceae bacterium]|nr:2'-5' RNA ligase family protein [Oscillospiraceae bacterium]
MTDNKHLYLLAQFDSATQAAFESGYAALKSHGFDGRQTKNIPYHFTLGSFDTGLEAKLTADLERVCGETAPVEFLFDHIGLFGLEVLFAAPRVTRELLDLYAKFSGNQTPHATVLIDDPDVILRALPVFSQAFKPVPARIESVALYEFFPTRFIAERKL